LKCHDMFLIFLYTRDIAYVFVHIFVVYVFFVNISGMAI